MKSTLSANLLAEQKKAGITPYAKLRIHAYDWPDASKIVRFNQFDWHKVHENGAGIQACACCASDDSFLITDGTTVTRFASPAYDTDFSTWQTEGVPGGLTSSGTEIGTLTTLYDIVGNPTSNEVMLFKAEVADNKVYYKQSTDYGASFGAWTQIGDTLDDVPEYIHATYKSNGDIMVLVQRITAITYSEWVKRTSGSWGATFTALGPVIGSPIMGFQHDGDWNVLIDNTGWTPDVLAAWSIGDGAFYSAGTSTSLGNLVVSSALQEVPKLRDLTMFRTADLQMDYREIAKLKIETNPRITGGFRTTVTLLDYTTNQLGVPTANINYRGDLLKLSGMGMICLGWDGTSAYFMLQKADLNFRDLTFYRAYTLTNPFPLAMTASSKYVFAYNGEQIFMSPIPTPWNPPTVGTGAEAGYLEITGGILRIDEDVTHGRGMCDIVLDNSAGTYNSPGVGDLDHLARHSLVKLYLGCTISGSPDTVEYANYFVDDWLYSGEPNRPKFTLKCVDGSRIAQEYKFPCQAKYNENNSNWYSPSWSYRKAFTVTGSSTGMRNYQLKLTVNYGSGISTTTNVYCASHCKTDFSDLRFTLSDGVTLIDYWIESYTASTSAVVWIEFPWLNVSAGGGNFYIYYGNADATDASNGTNTFILFDNFERGINGDAIGGSWTVDTGSVLISTDHAYGTGTRCAKFVGAAATALAHISQTAREDIAIQMQVWKETAAATAPRICHGDSATRANAFVEADEDIMIGPVDTGLNLAPDEWELIELRDFHYTGNSFDLLLNDALGMFSDNAAQEVDATSNNLIHISNEDGNAGNDVYIDNLIVRKWTASPPTFSYWGSEIGEPDSVRNIAEEIITSIGGTLTLTSNSTAFTTTAPLLTVQPNDSLGSVLKRLFMLVPDVIRLMGNAAYIIHPQTGDASVYSYQFPTTAGVHNIRQNRTFATGQPKINRIAVVGTDVNGLNVYAEASNVTGIEHLFFLTDPMIKTQADVEYVATMLLTKARLTQDMGYLEIGMNCGVELWDVITVTDSVANQSAQKYRVVRIQFIADYSKGEWYHILGLTAV